MRSDRHGETEGRFSPRGAAVKRTNSSRYSTFSYQSDHCKDIYLGHFMTVASHVLSVDSLVPAVPQPSSSQLLRIAAALNPSAAASILPVLPPPACTVMHRRPVDLTVSPSLRSGPQQRRR